MYAAVEMLAKMVWAKKSGKIDRGGGGESYLGNACVDLANVTKNYVK